MKKIVILLIIYSTFPSNTYSQGVGGLVTQKQTEKKYLLQQIAALKVFIGYAQKGYDIASKGINTIRNIKKGEFDLHRDFFGSLNNINPKIKKYAKLADVLAYQYRIIKKAKEIIREIQNLKQFTPDEIDYCKKVFDNLLDECVKTIDELITIITPDKYQMKDDERIKRIDMLYADIQEKYSFSQSFSDEMGILAMQRMTEQQEINRSRTLNGIH